MKRNKGSVLITALIFGTILSVLVASILNYAMGEYRIAHRSMDRDIAFHLAEAGVERAVYALQYNELAALSGSAWTRVSMDTFELIMDNMKIGNQVGKITSSITAVDDDSFVIKSVGHVDYKVGTVAKTVTVNADIIEAPNTSIVLRRPDFIVKEYMTLNGITNGPTQVASCDSTQYDDPILTPASKKNTGYDVVVASMREGSDSITFNKTWIDGSVGTAGYEISYDTEQNGERLDSHSRLQGPDTPNGVLWDNDRVIPYFNVDLPTPELPPATGYNIVEVDSNTWLTSNEVIVGTLNESTYVIAHGDLTFSDVNLVIQGDVIIYVDGKMTSSGNNTLTVNGSASGMTLMSKSELSLQGDLAVSALPPQILILGPEDGSNITINTKDFKGFINAPESVVNLNGTAPPQGNSKNDFWGGIIAESLNNDGTFELVSDSSMRDQNSTTDPNVLTHIVVVTRWSEG